MKKNLTYSDKLKDPRWQKKRLEILNRDNWACQSCGDDESTLHVHHKLYVKDAEPWEMENSLLITLCADCHLSETEYLPKSVESLGQSVKRHFLSSHIIDISAGFFNIEMVHSPEVVASALHYCLKNRECMRMILEKYFEYLSKRRKQRGDTGDQPF